LNPRNFEVTRFPITARWYLLMTEVWGGKIVDVEALKRLAVQLLALAEQCTDLLPLQRDLRKLANELVDLIEGVEQPEEARRSH
jgi:hypothetical protein